MVIEIGDNNIKGICKVKDLREKGLIKASIEMKGALVMSYKNTVICFILIIIALIIIDI